MIYRIVNLYGDRLLEMISTLGDKVVKSNYWHDADCVDVDIDPEIAILKINDGNLTIDVGAKLFTIPYEDYSCIKIIWIIALLVGGQTSRIGDKMLKIEELTEEQIYALRVMAEFECNCTICCDDCPLNLKDDCGSLLAQTYVKMIEKERKWFTNGNLSRPYWYP